MLPDLTPDEVTRLWSNILRKGVDDCWPWVLYTDRGYGQINIRSKAYRVPRLVYFLTTGKQPGRLRVRHTCDNRPCCNPRHLILGTALDNGRDMAERGRGTKPIIDHDLIRAYIDSGRTQREIADAMGCSQASVSRIFSGYYERPAAVQDQTIAYEDHRPCPVLDFYETARFWGNIIRCGPDDCWVSIITEERSGYGLFSFKSQRWQAHRIAYFLHHGVDPLELMVRHTCDNPPCCNPNHLILGTAKNNGEDMAERGRGRKTSFDKVLAQSYREEGLTLQQIAEVMGCTPSNIGYLLRGDYDRDTD